MDKEKTVILKVLVGSHAHKLADKDSDLDYRAVYVLPTTKILSLDHRYKGTYWVEGKEDNTAYEVGHFLHLAVKCNPSILEVLKAPVIEITKEGKELRKLFSDIWNPKDAFNAFIGYSLNQRKKMLNNQEGRPRKFAIAYIRTLINLTDLLKTGTFSLEVSFLKDELLRFKNGYYRKGEVIDLAEGMIKVAQGYLEECKHEPNLDKVNKFLLKVRKKYWDLKI